MPLNNTVLLNPSDHLVDIHHPRSKLECYGLPYGVFGFVSHLFTYYTLACLWHCRKPLWPIRHLTHGKFDFFIGVAGLTGTLISTTITIVKCRGDWEPLVIAVWNLSMSLLNAFTHLHVVYLCWKAPKKRDGTPYNVRHSVFWVALYVPGLVAGIAGLTSLVSRHSPKYRGLLYLSIGFWLIVCSTFIIGGIAMVTLFVRSRQSASSPHGSKQRDQRRGKIFGAGGFAVTILLFVLLGMLYSDWALSMMMGNTLGVPSNEAKPIAWTYWVAKRLPMFCW